MGLTRWRMSRRYGVTNRMQLQHALDASWEAFWLCRVQRKHLEKMGSHGRCYRCGKAMQ